MIQVRVKIDPKFTVRYRELGHFLASKFYDRLIANIRSNKYGFHNSEETIKRKGFDLPMIDSGTYINQIWVNDNKILVKEGRHESGIEFTELASILEFGRRDRGFTGYPVWRMTLEDFKKEVPELLKTHFK